jgi:hypothetical protein
MIGQCVVGTMYACEKMLYLKNLRIKDKKTLVFV